MSADGFAVTCLVAVELNAGRAFNQGLKKRLTLDKRQAPDVSAIEMQKVEGVIDESYVALAVGRSLGVGAARQSGFIDAAEFAIV